MQRAQERHQHMFQERGIRDLRSSVHQISRVARSQVNRKHSGPPRAASPIHLVASGSTVDED